MNKRQELIQSVKDALNSIPRLDVPNILDICTYTATIAVLKCESKIFSSTGDSHDAAYAIELDDMVREFQAKLEEFKR